MGTTTIKKSDLELRRDVEAELEWDPSLDPRDVGVAVADGVVTISGEVRTYAEKWRAEEAAERVAGVRAVVNGIEVKLAGTFSDTDIAKAAITALAANTLVKAEQVMVEVEKGWLILKGEVAHDYERRAAEEAVRYLPGVRGVANHIVVRPDVEPEALQDRIVEAFKRQAALDADRIQVDLDGDELILRGTVRSIAERHEAEKAAWSTRGVRKVQNLLTIAPDRAA